MIYLSWLSFRDQATAGHTHMYNSRHPPGQIVAGTEGQDGDAGRGVAPVHRVHHLKDARGRAVAAADLLYIYYFIYLYR